MFWIFGQKRTIERLSAELAAISRNLPRFDQSCADNVGLSRLAEACDELEGRIEAIQKKLGQLRYPENELESIASDAARKVRIKGRQAKAISTAIAYPRLAKEPVLAVGSQPNDMSKEDLLPGHFRITSIDDLANTLHIQRPLAETLCEAWGLTADEVLSRLPRLSLEDILGDRLKIEVKSDGAMLAGR